MTGCDGCSVCCKLLKIRELEKPAHTWCTHCKIGSGCTVYAERPESCRVYECVWLQTQGMGRPMPASLRPDRARVLIGTADAGESIVLYLSPDRAEAWKHPELQPWLAEFSQRRIPVYLSFGEELQRLC